MTLKIYLLEINVSFKNVSEAKRANDDYTKLVCIGSSSKHDYNFTIYLDLKTFAESLHNLSLKVAKLKQQNMGDRIERLVDYNLNKEKNKTQREIVLSNAKEFYKGRKMILIAFKNGAFPLAKQYPSGNVEDWKEDELD